MTSIFLIGFFLFVLFELSMLFLCTVLVARFVDERRRIEATQESIFHTLLTISDPEQVRAALEREEELRDAVYLQNWQAFKTYGLDEGT